MSYSAWLTFPVDFGYNVFGYVSPFQTDRIKEETRQGIEKASRGAAPAVIAETQRQAGSEIDATLRSFTGGSAHPDDIDPFGDVLRKLQKFVNVALIIGGIAAAVFLVGLLLKVFRFAKGGR